MESQAAMSAVLRLPTIQGTSARLRPSERRNFSEAVAYDVK